MKSILAALAVAFVLFVFTFYVDGEMGIILIAFLLIAPLLSLAMAVYARKRIRVSFDCDGYVKKGGELTVSVTIEKDGWCPLAVVEILPYASEVFERPEKSYRLSLFSSEPATFDFGIKAMVGGNGEVSLPEIRSCGFLGFIRLKLKEGLPSAKSVGVIPEIPDVKASSQLFRNIADIVTTSDDEEDNDTAMLFSANTVPGYEHREYTQGDPLKRVNWKLSSKKDKLMVRLDEAAASVQPMVLVDLYRSPSANAQEAVLDEEKILQSAFGLARLLVKQGIASTLVYRGSDGSMAAESVEDPDAPSQILLKALAVKVEPGMRAALGAAGASSCACVIASSDCGEGISALTDAAKGDGGEVCLIAPSKDSPNSTELPMWYLDGDNNFKLV
ncbi:MAG: DUF58 domain-containing protein [Ruminococcus sp.]|nr:DUF58 domain-containing protein [Ruminococcus sp.]